MSEKKIKKNNNKQTNKQKTLCTWSWYLQVVWKLDVGSAAVPLEVQPNPTLKRAAVNVSWLGDCLWTKRRRKKKKKKKESPTCLPAFIHSFIYLFFVVVHCYFVSLSRLVVLMWAVRQTVPSQVTVAPKHLSAAATAVGLDVCMGEKVSFQVTSLIKGSSACGAFVGRLLFRFKASKGLFPLIV